MSQYKVTAEVDYIVTAMSMSEAMTIVEQHSEHPLVGQGADSWCDDVRVISAAINKGD
jgi:hypothetical protein